MTTKFLTDCPNCGSRLAVEFGETMVPEGDILIVKGHIQIIGGACECVLSNEQMQAIAKPFIDDQFERYANHGKLIQPKTQTLH